MHLNYEKIQKKHESSGNHWASYSDLFMLLSFVFLLLYMVASFRAGSEALSAKYAIAQLESEKFDLTKQIKVFDTLKDNYLAEEATAEEKEMYDDLMQKLSLLEDEAKLKQKQIRNELLDQQDREKQLNSYQRMITSIISANMNAAAKLKKEREATRKKDRKLSKLTGNLKNLESEVKSRSKQLEKRQAQLEMKARSLIKAKEEQSQIEKRYQRAIASLRLEKDKELKSLKLQTQKRIEDLQKIKAEELRNIQVQNSLKLRRIKTKAAEELKAIQQRNNFNLNRLEKEHKFSLEKTRYDYQRKLAREKMSVTQKAKAKEDFEKKLSDLNSQYNYELKKLKNKIRGDENKINALYSDHNKLKQRSAALKRGLQDAKGKEELLTQKLKEKDEEKGRLLSDLKSKDNKLKAALSSRKRRPAIAKALMNDFRKAGVAAKINKKNGDLIIDFGDEYFDTDSYRLKKNMMKIIRRTVPVYAKSVMTNPKIKNQIEAIELIGFASPTYLGRTIDPRTLKKRDRLAVNYNLDLSYKRAREIFKYIFNTNYMKFSYQKELLPLLKVTGRSFFTENIKREGLKNQELSDFCKTYDCLRSQKVIIRFNLKD